MSFKLYAPFGYHKANLVKIAADLAQVKFDNVDLQWSDLQDQVFLQKAPLGKAPVIETQNGFIYETNAILRYVARLGVKTLSLIGNSLFETALIDQWLDFTNLEVSPVAFALTAPVFGWDTFSKERYQLARVDLDKLLRIIDDHLKINSFLVGNQVTIADILLVGTLHSIFRFILEENSRKTYQNVTRYFLHIAEKPYFVKYFGKPYLCKKEWELQEAPAQQQQQQGEKKPKPEDGGAQKGEKKPKPEDGGQKTEKQKKQPQQQQQQQQQQGAQPSGSNKKPAEKPQPAPKPPKVEDDDGEEKPAAPKQKNPLDLLPPSTFVLYDFKTLIVNAQDKKAAVKTFFEQFDPQGFSIWYSQFRKGEGECKRLFLTQNLRNGFFEKFEEFRKYSFSALGIYGEAGNYEIRGVWVWRGTDIPQILKESDCYESFDWKKLDIASAEDKALLETYWTSLEEGQIVEGLPVADAAYFK